MQAAEARRAVAAAMSSASALDLAVDDAVVLNDSNRLVVRLMPCDVVARVTPLTHPWSAEREVDLVRRLAETDSPVAGLEPRVEPRVFERDGFAISMWTYFEPVASSAPIRRVRAGARSVCMPVFVSIDVTAPHVMDRVSSAQQDVANQDVTPDLAEMDRELLAVTLRDLREVVVNRHAAEQLLHGEPHPGNVLDTTNGPLFMDFENGAHGPVEYDLAWVPKEVSERYPGADQDLVDECRGIVLAIIAMHRWRRGDEHPSGRQSGVAFVDVLRAGPPWPSIDAVSWSALDVG